MVDYVEHKLRLDWSPEQIAAKLQLDHPDDPAMRVSLETIYRWVYLDARMGGSLCKHLQRRKNSAGGRSDTALDGDFVADRAGIETRSSVVDGRHRFGDWEGDTLAGKRNRSHLVTHVERRCRFLLAGKLEDRTADTCATRSLALHKAVPEHLRHTLTLDNGSKCAQFPKIEAGTGMDVYFAGPHAVWQRGTNENTNGLICPYFPKGTDFRRVADTTLHAAVERLNHRPEKCLGLPDAP